MATCESVCCLTQYIVTRKVCVYMCVSMCVCVCLMVCTILTCVSEMITNTVIVLCSCHESAYLMKAMAERAERA